VDRIVLRGLEKNRELRFDNAIAFRDAIVTMLNSASAGRVPLPSSARAAMPTARDMPPTPIDTATVPMRSAGDRFGTTADMTGRPSSKRQKVIVLAATALLLGGSAAGAIATARVRKAQMLEAPTPTAAAAKRLARTATPAELPAPTPAPAPAAVAPAPAPVAAPAEAAVVHAAAIARDVHGKKRGPARPVPAAASAPAIAVAAADVPVKPAQPAAGATPEAPAAPPARGVREVLGEAEKLLGQGEVGEACARGEEANHLAPKSPQVHKFLGKCYMRAGRTREANDNYKLYLELAPNAPDAPFVKSMIK
jgi:hypothetical protein